MSIGECVIGVGGREGGGGKGGEGVPCDDLSSTHTHTHSLRDSTETEESKMVGCEGQNYRL